MSTLAIFLLGVIVTAITFVASLLVGLSEAADPEQSRMEDLTEIEKKVVDREDPVTSE